jgi:hypothetical protein
MLMAQRLKVTGDDCGATNIGISVEGEDPEIVGAVAARDVGNVKAGDVIEKRHLPSLKGKKPLIRSVATCQQEQGICKKCAGKRDQGKFPTMGSFIGIHSARVVSEPMTQSLGLSAKHLGGVVGVNDQNVSGFEEINQFVQIPKSFKGAAVLASQDGKVRQIVKAPQGGYYVHVNSDQLYVPPGRSLQVQKGSAVEAGDVLTDGTPNPAELAHYKGIGAGRMYFTNKLSEILNKNGVPTHRRNVETLSRAFFDQVRVTNEDGVLGHPIDSVLSYSELQRRYQPRKGAKASSPKRSVGQYLERPILHYSIGTKITPNVAKMLEAEKIDQITTHRDPPGFVPEITRMMGISAKDPDWKVRMAGFGIKKSFLEAARKGSESPKDSTSYVSALMDPTRL